MKENEPAVRPVEDGEGYLAHALDSKERRTGLRDDLTILRDQLVYVIGYLGDLDDVDCGSDCCIGSRERAMAMHFLQDAERSLAAGRALLHLETS